MATQSSRTGSRNARLAICAICYLKPSLTDFHRQIIDPLSPPLVPASTSVMFLSLLGPAPDPLSARRYVNLFGSFKLSLRRSSNRPKLSVSRTSKNQRPSVTFRMAIDAQTHLLTSSNMLYNSIDARFFSSSRHDLALLRYRSLCAISPGQIPVTASEAFNDFGPHAIIHQ